MLQQIPPNERANPRSLRAKCDECPLHNRVPCHAQYNAGAKLIVVGDAPDDNEERFGVPFIGDSGRFLRNLLYRTQIKRSELHITNALLCNIPYGMSKRDIKLAIKCCAPRLQHELSGVASKHIVAFGEWAQLAITGKEGIFKWMGAVHAVENLGGLVRSRSCISTLHPSYIRGKDGNQYTPVVPRHFYTVAALVHGKLGPWEWPEYSVHPDERAVEYLRRIKRSGLAVGFDVENIPSNGKLMCLSLATEECAVSVPWDDYWKSTGQVNGLHCYKHGPEIRQLIVDILGDESIDKVMQNGMYDLAVMKDLGVPIRGFKWDTMLMHAIAYPPMRHTLNHIACQYTHAPRWKDEFRAHKDEKGEEAFVEADELELREYNVRDSMILPALFEELHKDLTDLPNGMAQYHALFERATIALHMKERGVPIDVSVVEPKQKILQEHVDLHLSKLRDMHKAVCGEGEFNPDSNKQIRHLFIDVLEAPILSTSDTGDPTVDKKVLTAYMADTNPMVQYAAKEVLSYRKWKKMNGFLLKGSLNGVPIENGVCHTAWKTHGTRTGRWSSPLLILPKEKVDGDVKVPGMRDLITGFNGNWFVEADYKSLELVVVALLAGDQEMLDIFASNGDIHREVAKKVFRTKEPTKQQRSIVKTFNYGLVYGASDSTLWKTLRASGVTMTVSDVSRVRTMWFESRPAVKAYLDKALAKAKRDDYIEAPLSGRRYYFYGRVEPAKVYNNPVQMTAADLINQVFPAIYRELHWPEEGILFQYHDAVIIDTPDPLRGYDILKNNMTQEVSLNGCKALFQVDVEIGKSWHTAVSVTREEAARLGKGGDDKAGA